MDLAIPGDLVMLDRREAEAVIVVLECMVATTNHSNNCDCLQCDATNLIDAALKR